MMEDLTGKQLGPYQVVASLGEGGMAAVYKAYQPGMERYVALKILPRHFAIDPEFVGRFEQEAKVLANLRHTNILPVFDFGEADGYTYIVMPFLESGDLTDLLRGEPLPLEQIHRVISQVGDALDYAHSRGLVHRDIKPSNVLLDERGNCLLSDFGITKIVEGTAHFTATGGFVGTPAYMSPEQGLGKKLDGRSDIYALGIMLYEMATGRVPYRAETPMAVVVKHINDPLPLPRQVNPDVPEAVEQVILKALAKQPEDRFGSASDMVQALEAAVLKLPRAGKVATATAISSTKPPLKARSQETIETLLHVPPKQIGRYIWPVVIATIVIFIIGGVFLYRNLSVVPTSTEPTVVEDGTVDSEPDNSENSLSDISPLPQEGKVAFASRLDFSNWDIYVLGPDGQKRMTTDSAIDVEPAWSPDGSKLAFASDRDGNWEIYTLTPDGLKRMTSNKAMDREPAWSPDGSKLAFASDRDGNWEIYLLTSEGLKRMTHNDASDREPVWSPDGSKLAFTSNRHNGQNIYLLDATGESTRLTEEGVSESPAWMPSAKVQK